MKTRRKVKAASEETPDGMMAGSLYGDAPRRQDEGGGDDPRLLDKIDGALDEIRQSRLEARAHDEEIARLGEQTRRLIAEMLRDLNLKAA